MKPIITSLLLLIALSTFAQKTEWKELHSFHAVMSKTFHPAEENNLKPLRDSASLLLERAKIWQQAPIPSGFDAKLTKTSLVKLVADCEAVVKAVKANKSDEELKKLITKTHDTFHEIMEKCREGEHH